MPRTESNLFADNSQNRKFYYRNGLPGRISFPDRHSARRSPPAGVRSGPQGRHATALKGGSSREPTCLEQIGSAMSKGNLAHHHTCPAFCPRYSMANRLVFAWNSDSPYDAVGQAAMNLAPIC